jgi:hypothetical protein
MLMLSCGDYFGARVVRQDFQTHEMERVHSPHSPAHRSALWLPSGGPRAIGGTRLSVPKRLSELDRPLGPLASIVQEKSGLLQGYRPSFMTPAFKLLSGSPDT